MDTLDQPDQVELTIKLPAAIAARVKRIASEAGNSEEAVLSAALESYVYLTAEQMVEVELGIREADAGKFASDEEVRAVFAKYGVVT